MLTSIIGIWEISWPLSSRITAQIGRNSSRLCREQTEYTRMNAWPLLIESRCIAGNWWDPVVSVIWSVHIFLLQLITYNCIIVFFFFFLILLYLFVSFTIIIVDLFVFCNLTRIECFASASHCQHFARMEENWVCRKRDDEHHGTRIGCRGCEETSKNEATFPALCRYISRSNCTILQ